VLDNEVLLLAIVVLGVALTVEGAVVVGRGQRRRGAEDARVTRVTANKRRGLRRGTGSGSAAGCT
jgi:hypothetical protein